MPDLAERTETQAGAPEASQSVTQDQSVEHDNDWMNALVRGAGTDLSDETVDAGDGSEQAETSEAASQGSSTETTTTSQSATLTREEADQLIASAVAQAQQRAMADLDRKVQSEVDRREAARKKKEMLEKRKELRETDPFAFAELDKELEKEADTVLSTVEQEQERKIMIQTVMQNSGALYDKHVLDPLIGGLPKEVADQVFKEIGPNGVDGLEGRANLVKTALGSLAQHYEKQAEAKAIEKLRKNPAFRKEILAELRGEEEDPEIISGTVAALPTPFDMNSQLRHMTGRYVPSQRR